MNCEGQDFIFHMCILWDKTFNIIQKRFDLVTLNLLPFIFGYPLANFAVVWQPSLQLYL